MRQLTVSSLWRPLWCVGILTALLWVAPAYAYRSARIGADQAEVKDAPDDSGLTKSVMAKGTRVNTSDQATNGYYRVRSAADTGWVKESDIDFNGAPPPPPSQAQRRRERNAPERMEDHDREENDNENHWALKAFGGLDFWQASDLSSMVSSTALQTGGGIGGEIDYFISSRLGLALRIESLSKSSSGTATVPVSGSSSTESDNVSFSLSSVPVMVGFDLVSAKGDNFSLDVAGYLGEGLSTQVTETDTTQSTSYQISASAVTFLVDADLNWHISNPFWFYLEAGYRYLKTQQATASSSGAGSLFGTTPVDIDLSGPVLNFGLRINF